MMGLNVELMLQIDDQIVTQRRCGCSSGMFKIHSIGFLRRIAYSLETNTLENEAYTCGELPELCNWVIICYSIDTF
jgi:hypothetical protein